MRTVHHMPQRSDEWFQIRLGKLTGSRAGDMLAEIGSGESAKRRDLRYTLVCERLTGQSQDRGFVNADMQWGTDHEAEAVAAYETETGALVESVGFISLDGVQAGCSPDGLIDGGVGLVSIKCPRTANHVRVLREGRVPAQYVGQCLCELWVTGAQWVDFVTFDPRLPDRLRLGVIRFNRDDAAVGEFGRKALAFLEEVDREEAALRGWSVMHGVSA